MPNEKLRPAFTFTEDRLKELESVVPEAFADGRVNWDTLREALGETLDDEGRDAEHFGLNWPGKREARRLAAKPSHGTLLPAPGEGVNEDTTSHLFIEGDNLEVLKLLQKSYAGRVKMIYIDPPYNTGNDFVYKDDFSEPLESYLERSGQSGEKGELLTTNPKAGGRFHSNWLNMIYPRLRLARTLLRDDGVIFVSIDDNEVHHLRSVMAEIFGEENFLANCVWQKKYSPQNDAKFFSESHEHLLCYSRMKETFTIGLLDRTDEANARYKNPDGDPRGDWKSSDLTRAEYRKRDDYIITSPKTGKQFEPPKGNSWGRPKDVVEALIKDKRIWFGSDGNSIPSLKRFLTEVKQGITPQTIWLRDEVGDTQDGKKQIKDIFGDVSVFDTPKPTRLIRKALQIAGTNSNTKDIILDFFAGSASTAHAVLQQNHDDGGNRQFIMVQVPEPTNSPDLPTIADIGEERVRRVIAKLQQQPPLPRDTPEDLGFRVLKLAPSHFKQWREAEGQDLDTIRSLFDDFETPLCDGWTPDGLLSETLLLEGFPLDSTVEPVAVATNTVQRVTSPTCGHALLACFDKTLKAKTVESLDLGAQDVFVCLDSALSDDLKLRLSQSCTLKTI